MIFQSGGIGNSNDNIFAGNGNDTLLLAPNSQLIAGNGIDTVHAQANDTITLGNGKDTVFAGANNTVSLGNGNDTVHAGPNNMISLGTGSDTIVFGVSPYPTTLGQETISGFSTQHDQIAINKTLIGSFADVVANAHQVLQDTVINIPMTSDTITLQGVALSSLQAHDFLFV
jgi:Ca2+-binding RTX toxin-like protein